MIVDVRVALADCEKVVHDDAEDSLYSTLMSLSPLVSFGSVQVAVNRSAWPVAAVPTFANVGEPTALPPLFTPL